MNKYDALQTVWDDSLVVNGRDNVGLIYIFKRMGNRFKYTREGVDEWFDITVTEFLNDFHSFEIK